MPIISKKDMTEEDIKLNYITPALYQSGWKDKITMETKVKFTDGKINLQGNITSREPAKKADYILYINANNPIAIVEAKDNNHSVSYGLQQAMSYAKMLDIPFAYSSNGDSFFEHDFLTGLEREIPLNQFPSYDELIERFEKNANQGHGLDDKEKKIINQPYYSSQNTYEPRYYQRIAINKTVDAIAKGLTNDGIETPGHKQKWHASTVRSILTNEKYKGEALLQKYYTPDFLTKKQKINNGEIQQYYVENNHPAIIEPDTFEMVRLEMDRRLMLNGKYSGTDILTSRIKCGECGGSYGAKVWHSNDKYRKIMYQCNRKYAGKEDCKTPAIRSEDIENRFVEVVNSLIENKDEIISNLEIVLDKICNKKELSKEKEKLENSLTEQVEKIQELIDMNSRVAQNQEKYKKEYDAMIKTYDETKFKYEQLEIESSQQAAKHQMIKDYINTLKKQNKPLTKFDGLMWGSLLESATIIDKDTIVFKFKDGTEING